MILSRTPLRMSFVGGGSDLKSYYSQKSGAVISTTINHYIYVAVNLWFDKTIRVSYSKGEIVKSVDEVEHDIIREALKLTGFTTGIEVAYLSDISFGKGGTGLGGSSALTVGTLHALHALKGDKTTKEQLAREACEIEIELLKRPIGKQDQYAAAYGGLSHIQFNPDESVVVEPLNLKQEIKDELQNNLLLFYTGMATESNSVLTEQKDNIPTNLAGINEMVDLAQKLKMELQGGNIAIMGQLLHENWLRKKKLASRITNATIDEYYAEAQRAGALGGKILGAGGGGFMLLYVKEDKREAVREALKNLTELPFKFESEGSVIAHEDMKMRR